MRARADTGSTALFFVLACAITWLLAFPTAWAWMHHRPLPPYAIALAGLSAFGPLLAALDAELTKRKIPGVALHPEGCTSARRAGLAVVK